VIYIYIYITNYFPIARWKKRLELMECLTRNCPRRDGSGHIVHGPKFK
jgi:Ribonuclease G/E